MQKVIFEIRQAEKYSSHLGRQLSSKECARLLVFRRDFVTLKAEMNHEEFGHVGDENLGAIPFEEDKKKRKGQIF